MHKSCEYRYLELNPMDTTNSGSGIPQACRLWPYIARFVAAFLSPCAVKRKSLSWRTVPTGFQLFKEGVLYFYATYVRTVTSIDFDGFAFVDEQRYAYCRA